jgi:beta-glucosidase-like glycosyl hydrolase
VTVSDDFETRAISEQLTPARRAINAGLDLVLYAETEAASEQAYQELYHDTEDGSLNAARIRAAAAAVLVLKRSLNLL